MGSTAGSSVSPDPQSRISPPAAAAAGSEIPGFKTGDMVWGAVRSHPWWPGQIYNESLALPAVMQSKLENHLLIAFFGDSSYGWLHPSDLVPFDPNFEEFSKQSTSRNFVYAVEDAVDEVGRRAALGLATRFRPSVLGCFRVDVPGFDSGDYSMEQIEEARGKVRMGELIEFQRELAVAPWRKEVMSIEWIRKKAMLLAYRKTRSADVDIMFDHEKGAMEMEESTQDVSVPSTNKKLASRHSKPSVSDLITASRRRQHLERLSTSRPTTRPSTITFPVAGATLVEPSSVPQTVEEVDDPEIKASVEEASLAMGSVDVVKKTPKRPLENPKPRTGSIEKTAKKAKRESSIEAKPQGKPTAKPIDSSSSGEEETRAKLEKKHDSIPSLSIETSMAPSVPDLNMPQLLSDLRSLAAVDLFYKNDEEGLAQIKSVFESFRTLVYRKSLRNSSLSIAQSPRIAELGQSVVPQPPAPQNGTQEVVTLAINDGLGMPLQRVQSPNNVESRRSPTPLNAAPEVAVPVITDRKRVESDKVEERTAQTTKDLDAQMSLNKKRKLENAPQSVAPLKLRKQLDSRMKKDVDSAVVPLKSKQQLESGKKDVDSTMSPLKPKHQLEAVKKNLSSTVSPSKPREQLESGKGDVVSVPPSRPKELLKSGNKNEDLAVRKPMLQTKSEKKDVSSVAPSKPKEQLESGKKDVSSSVAPSKPKEHLVPGTAKNMASVVAPLKLNQQPDSGSNNKESSTVSPSNIKQQQANTTTKKVNQKKPRPASPTYLVMQFPSGEKLPVASLLNTRLSRLGQIDASKTTVNWKDSSCRVLFKHKSDAEIAFKYVNSRTFFGQVEVEYRLQDATAPSRQPAKPQQPKKVEEAGLDRDVSLPRKPLELQPKPSYLKKAAEEAGRAITDATLPTSCPEVFQSAAIMDVAFPESELPPGFENVDMSLPIRQRPELHEAGFAEPAPMRDISVPAKPQPELPPKPCIKKIDSDRAEAVVKEVRFRETVADQLLPPPPAIVTTSQLNPSINVEQLPFPTRVWTRPPPPPPPPQSYRGVVGGPSSLGPPPSVIAATVPFKTGEHGAYKGGESNVDISREMMSLLLKCNEVVDVVKMSFGYLPYHPI